MAANVPVKTDAVTIIDQLIFESVTVGATTGKAGYSKIGFGADGSFTLISASAGLPVAQQGTWTVGVSGSVTIADGGGSITVDDGGTTLSIDDGGGSITVDGSVTVSGTVAVSGVVDVTPASPAANDYLPVRLTNGSAFDPTLTVAGTVTANAGTGTFVIGDGGGSITVDGSVSISGTVTVDSELPAAAALADNTSNPACPAVGSFLMVWDGSTWDRGKGDSTDGVLVNLGANNDVTCSQTGTWNIGTVTSITNAVTVVGSAAEDAALSGNPVRMGVRASYAEPTAMSADGDVVSPWADRRGRLITKKQAGTGTQTSVGDSTSNVTLLAANTQRLGASIYNDSSATLYVRFAATATTSNFSVKLFPDDYCEVPSGYTGIIDGLWSSDAGGNARVTEYT